MMHRPLTSALFIFSVLAAAAAAPPDAAPPGPATAPAAPVELSPSQLQSDFDLMRRALEEAHPGLYRYSTKAQMDREFDTQRAKLSRPMTRLQFDVVVSQTLASIHCGHTRMHWDPQIEAAMRDQRTFPLRVEFEGPRLMVLLNQTPDDQTIHPGMQLLSVNGRSVADLVAQFWPVTYADGDIETTKRRGIAWDFAKDYWWLIDQTDHFTVTAADPATGKTVTSQLPGVINADRKANHNPVNDAMLAGLAKVRGESYEKRSLRFPTDPADADIAQLRIPSFTGEDLPHWIEDAFRTLHERGTKKLIIDLRGNGGGEDSYGVMLVSCLMDSPFRYGDRATVKTITWSFQDHWDAKPLTPEQLAHIRKCLTPNPDGGYFISAELQEALGEKQPGKFPFPGDVFILTDGATFSTAADVCAVIHHLKRATFIGEETAGAYQGNNSGTEPTVTLPNSKARFGLPLSSSWNAVSPDTNPRHGTIPDHPEVTKTSDLLRGIDTPMELALRLARTP